MNSRFQPAPSPVTEALILICEKCGKKLTNSSDRDDNPAVILQKMIKEQIRDEYGKGKFRCVITSCLDVCPQGELTVAISPTSQKESDRFFTFEETVNKTVAKEIIDLAKNLRNSADNE